MTNAGAEHVVADEASAHSEEIRSEFDLRVGKHISRGVIREFALDIARPEDHARAVTAALSKHDITPFWEEPEVETELIERAELGIPITPLSDKT
ncbi:hypothetical protein [Bosea sp. BIWAKO-01]|uniref:hypothetical protein n=1 Tax=Bosea sp. BIWAKO-01 TaxID=506668 RepID=UPI000852F821|nr:hypothetical protein [Bosea sp. BIWAKO-01]GAU86136.1 hypothetical protein BIWAKO_06084 [Bosea sp. BIWAKO-01]